jgi:2'-5' RNA ligase
VKPRLDPRVFLALRFSRTTQERLHAIQQELKQFLFNWHFIPDQNFHLTLRFFGDTPLDRIREINAQCNEIAADMHPFQLHLNRVDFFGSPSSARVLFASGDSSPGLSRLVAEIQRRFPNDMDQRSEFRPHVTLAKARKDMEQSLESRNAFALRRLREQGRIGPHPINLDTMTVHREFVMLETVWVGRTVEYELRSRYGIGHAGEEIGA